MFYIPNSIHVLSCNQTICLCMLLPHVSLLCVCPSLFASRHCTILYIHICGDFMKSLLMYTEGGWKSTYCFYIFKCKCMHTCAHAHTWTSWDSDTQKNLCNSVYMHVHRWRSRLSFFPYFFQVSINLHQKTDAKVLVVWVAAFGRRASVSSTND